MQKKNRSFFKVWGVPVLLSVITFIGLLLAIMGIGIWHVFSWTALSIPVYIMVRYGLRFFK
ncbi:MULTISPECIES: hypothetical protein [Pedobacter]|uniref:Uncharacterized protein n=1 Tax=Pedobacter heparinus (strain ATCC 13125 / DSM 2366 / CIP 104194 / JCM 7457 / NBRC 12017 / NCIMB 9290 / NRRL B-14731 / HIM 762-3) TaxID=485917 RepID=C6Y247_PEDHD|nr:MULTISPECIES: hypothetical protein [Pedobacter]ACU03040.1 conserved hypothetical protein [Pedobacter heparinus DSM 2366]MBB5438419.1 hypothetical protein [Pedobacter sp. AK017]